MVIQLPGISTLGARHARWLAAIAEESMIEMNALDAERHELMKLDRAGLDYLLTVAREIGFRALTVDTHEAGDFHAPTIMIEFQQTREPIGIEQVKPASPPASASFAMGKLKDMNTLDDSDVDNTDNL